jgi:VWFA-related protein
MDLSFRLTKYAYSRRSSRASTVSRVGESARRKWREAQRSLQLPSYHQAGGILRRILIFALLAATAVPSNAAKRLSLAKLERLLAADTAAHKQDAEIARQIEGVALTERMPDAAFARMAGRFGSGSQTAVALRLLADESQFLEAAPDQAAAKPAPDGAAQARILDAAREYVSKTLQRLPNFLSTRVISRYDDTPHADKPGDWPTRIGLHLVATARAQSSVSYDRENQPTTQGSAAWRPGTGLVSGGEFGTTLGMVLADITKGEVTWSHWHRTSSGTLAVFHYSVPASASHFEVFSSYRPEAATEAVRSAPNSRGISTVTIQTNVDSSNIQLLRATPAYHGTIWIDPADGVVYRITMETDAKLGLQILRRAAILVDYGPVEIAGKTYICPVRSLAQAAAVTSMQSRLGDDATEWLNETVFTDYHRFGSSVRILGEQAKSSPNENAPEREETATSSGVEPAVQNPSQSAPAQLVEKKAPAIPPAPPISTAPPVSPPASTAIAPETSANASQAAAVPAPASVASAAQPAVDTIGARPAQPGSGAPEEPGVTLHVNVNSLLVPAVVLDKTGQAVGDLGKQDFVVFDNGKQRKITGLTLVKSSPIIASGRRQSGPEAAADGAPMTVSAAQTRRYVIFLFDDRHMNATDLQIAKKAAGKLFGRPLPEGEYADVLSLMGANSGITRDDAALQSAVMKLTVHQASQNVKENCPNVDYYAADQIIHHHNPFDFQLAVQNAKQCTMLQFPPSSPADLYSGISNPNDPFQRAAMGAAESALAVGDEDARESLLSVRNVVQVMTRLPGQRILILVSPGFFTLSQQTIELESEILNLAAASDVTVNALDARGLAGEGFDASQGGTSMGMVTGQLAQERLGSMQAKEGVLSELAAGTGGRFFHDNNDLQGGMEKLSAAPQNLYLLEVSLQDVKANGSYHRLKVKVDRPGLEVLARKGYAAPKRDAGKK